MIFSVLLWLTSDELGRDRMLWCFTSTRMRGGLCWYFLFMFIHYDCIHTHLLLIHPSTKSSTHILLPPNHAHNQFSIKKKIMERMSIILITVDKHFILFNKFVYKWMQGTWFIVIFRKIIIYLRIVNKQDTTSRVLRQTTEWITVSTYFEVVGTMAFFLHIVGVLLASIRYLHYKSLMHDILYKMSKF